MYAVLLWLGLIINVKGVGSIYSSIAGKYENIYELCLVGPYCLTCINLFKRK